MKGAKSNGARSALQVWHRLSQQAASLFARGESTPCDDAVQEPETLERAVNELRLHALCYNESKQTPLLCLHGIQHNAWSWVRVGHELKQQRRFLSVSLRGHGRSSSPQGGYQLEDTSRDVRSLMDALDLEKVDLAGHSWGGKVAMHFASMHPERVRSLVLADPVPAGGLNPLLRRIAWMVAANLKAERGPYPNRDLMQEAGMHMLYLRHWDRLDRRLWQDNFDEDSDGAMQHRLGEAAFDEIVRDAIGRDIREQARSIRCPVLLLIPRLTISFFPGDIARFRGDFPQAVVEMVRGDHTFIHTNPRETARRMQSFLDGLGG